MNSKQLISELQKSLREFQARLVAYEYSQMLGVDFVESYAPVINDINSKILLIQKLMKSYSARIVDVKMALLHEKLHEEMHIKPPSLRITLFFFLA